MATTTRALLVRPILLLPRFAALAVLVLITPVEARAVKVEGGTPAAVTSPVELPTVNVVGTAEEAARLPGSGHRVTTGEIRGQSYDDINRVLRRVPGVYLREEDGFGLFPNISLRGVDPARSGKITIMEDGVLSAPAPYSAPSAYYSPSTGRMHAIEVLKGSSQVEYGPHTTGGVINYISTPIPVAKTSYAKQLIGTDNETRTHLYLGDTIEHEGGNFGYLLEGVYRESDGFKHRDETDDFRDGDETGFRRVEPMLKLAWEPNSSAYQRYEFKLGYSDQDADEGYLGLSESDFLADPYRQYQASRFDHFESNHTRTYLRHFIQATEDLNIATTAYYNKFHRNWFKLHDVSDDATVTDEASYGASNRLTLSKALAETMSHLGVLRGEQAGSFRVRNNNRNYYSYGLESVANKLIGAGERSHDVTAGVRYHIDKVRRFQTDEFFVTDGAGRILDAFVGTAGAAGNRFQETHGLALFAKDEIRCGRWTLTPGVRWENLEFSTTGAADGSLDMIAGGIGFTYDYDPETILYGGVHQGFSPPSPRGNLIAPELEEETSLGSELGVRYKRYDGALAVDATLFFTAFEDLIVPDSIGGAGSGDGDDENVGEVDAYGLEFAGTFDAGIANDWDFNNPFFVALTLTQAELKNDVDSTDAESLFAGGFDGAEVPYIPEVQVAVGAAVEGRRTGVEVIANYVDSTFTSASNVTTQIDAAGDPDSRFGETDSRVVVDVAGYYQWSDEVRLLTGVQNVFDEEYIVSRHPHGPRPGKPLFWYAGVEIDLNQ